MATSEYHSPVTRHLLKTACILFGMTLATGCNSQSGSAPAADGEFRQYTLTLHGYNYTDLEISSYEVNGQGGGNVEVSREHAGGSGSVCCVSVFAPMTQPRPVTIKWNPTGDKWCEQTVSLKPPLPAKPEYFEVHFYPDGHIEVAVTDNYSPARLRLARKHRNSRHQDERQNVDNSSKFARCQNGYF
ncbi:MAG: DUF3304 domain-containing protein [Thiobacillus sp.]|nr:DUF3304 domain-containing protein [Thiobacillus sp.]